jgi:hypothetical protein
MSKLSKSLMNKTIKRWKIILKLLKCLNLQFWIALIGNIKKVSNKKIIQIKTKKTQKIKTQ